jgi:hypothetical protein
MVVRGIARLALQGCTIIAQDHAVLAGRAMRRSSRTHLLEDEPSGRELEILLLTARGLSEGWFTARDLTHQDAGPGNRG